MILFGKSREDVFPDAWIQCGLFSGRSKVNILDSREIHSYPVIAVRETLDFVNQEADYIFLGTSHVWPGDSVRNIF